MELPLLEVIKITVDIFWASSWPKYEVTYLCNSTIAPVLSTAAVCPVLSCFSGVWLFATLWTVAQQAPLSMGFFLGKNTGVGCHFLLQASSWPKDWTRVSRSSCTAGRLFPGWAIWVLLLVPILLRKTMGPERLDYFSDEEIHLKGCRVQALNPRYLTQGLYLFSTHAEEEIPIWYLHIDSENILQKSQIHRDSILLSYSM